MWSSYTMPRAERRGEGSSAARARREGLALESASAKPLQRQKVRETKLVAVLRCWVRQGQARCVIYHWNRNRRQWMGRQKKKSRRKRSPTGWRPTPHSCKILTPNRAQNKIAVQGTQRTQREYRRGAIDTHAAHAAGIQARAKKWGSEEWATGPQRPAKSRQVSNTPGH